MKLMISAALIVATTAANAQTLTLPEAVRSALASEPALAAATAERDIAAAAADEAESALDPHLQLSGSIVQFDEPMVVSPIHGFTPGLIPEFDTTLIQSAISASWLLWDGGRARARVAESELLESSAVAGIDRVTQELIQRAGAAFLAVRTRSEMLAAEDQRLEAVEVELSRVNLLHEVGRAADVEVLRADAARAAAEAERTAAATALEVAERELARMTSLPLSRTRASNLASAPLGGPSFSRDALEASALDANPIVRQARERAAAQSAAVRAAEASRRPELRLASAIQEYGSDDGDFLFEWNAGIHLRFDLFDGGARGSRIERARAGERLALARLRMVEDEVRSALDRSIASLEEASARVESLGRAERGLAEVARIERLRLENGAGTQSDYLRAEADLVGARAALAAARNRVALARIEIARVGGELDLEWLEAALGTAGDPGRSQP